MSLTYTDSEYVHFNQDFAGAVALSVQKINLGSTLTSNLDFLMDGTSALSNEVWGGIKRADIIDLGRVTSADALEWQRNLLEGITASDPATPARAKLFVNELYDLWLENGIGYYGDSASQPLFLTKIGMSITVGSGYLSSTGYTYYGYDSGPNLYYGSIAPRVLVGSDDNKEYVVHACRWSAGDSRVYLRLDNPDILATDVYTDYLKVFGGLTIGTTLFKASDISDGFEVDGGVGFYWDGITTNPFGSVGSTTDILFTGAQKGPFGLEIYNASGDLIIDITSRLPRFVATGTLAINAGQSSTVYITGLQNNDTWDVIAAAEPTSSSAGGMPISIVAVYSGYFTITNDGVYDGNFTYWVLRT